MAKKMSAKEVNGIKEKLAEVGIAIDWEKFKNFNYMQFVTAVSTVVKLLTDLFRSEVGFKGTCPDPDECAATCKEHFELIQTIAECGAECCEECDNG